ncbi:hypothetical protein Taro_027250, partial [Colocasia esculenta]|nr:hypothetical protein [Colocasia esculenta]
MLQALSQKMKKWSTSVDTSPSQVDTELSQVDTRCLSQGTVLPSLRQCVDTPYGQVDTLWKLYDLKFLLDTWHPRKLMDWPWIVCPRTPRVPLDYLGWFLGVGTSSPMYRLPPNCCRSPWNTSSRQIQPSKDQLFSITGARVSPMLKAFPSP